MNERIMTRGFPWGEPAHPGIVKQYEDLLAIYAVIRGQLQSKIDDAFDRVSSKIGFVVSTTIPATLEIADKGKSAAWAVAEPLKGSMFEGELMGAVGGSQTWKASPGTYNLYLLWYDALKLKLRKDWLEPVHYLRDELASSFTQAATAAVRPEVQEPAHWFLPSATIAAEEKVVISVIDEVYPELKLAERISATRQTLRRVLPEVMEPAHLRPTVAAESALREISQLFKAVRPDIPEPAHFRFAERDILSQVQAVLRKYGM